MRNTLFEAVACGVWACVDVGVGMGVGVGVGVGGVDEGVVGVRVAGVRGRGRV